MLNPALVARRGRDRDPGGDVEAEQRLLRGVAFRAQRLLCDLAHPQDQRHVQSRERRHVTWHLQKRAWAVSFSAQKRRKREGNAIVEPGCGVLSRGCAVRGVVCGVGSARALLVHVCLHSSESWKESGPGLALG